VTTVEELTRPPRLGPIYRSAALRRSVGDSTPDTTLSWRGVTVDRAHLAEYDRVCGFRLTDELPATYPHVLAFPLAMALMARPEFPLPLLGLVHIENRIELHRPLTTAEPLDFLVRGEALRPHDRGTQVDVVARATVGEETVWTSRSTYLRRASGSSARTAVEPAAAPGSVIRVPRSTAVDYAAVSGDRNPIHTSRLLARAFGFPRPIAHGMWTLARSVAALEGRLPGAYVLDASFKLPVLLPATVALATTPTADGWQLTLRDARTAKPHLSATVSGQGDAAR
jgi:acyl dehydratase